MYIGYRSAMIDKKSAIKQEKKIVIPKRTKFLSNLSRFLIIILLASYNSNRLYFFSIHVSSFISVPSKKRKEFYSQFIEKDV